MKDAVKCPGCGLSAVLDIAIKQFQCSKCKKSYCRYCEMEWHLKPHTLCIKTKTRKSQDSGATIQIPAHWTDDCDKEIYTTVELDHHCDEFKEIQEIFMSTFRGASYPVQKIYRIQNLRLWDRYSLMRSHMVADLTEMQLREMRLFHGTRQSVVDAICREGFDWRLSGKHGTAYGIGTYFAKNASYSHKYCQRDSDGFGLPFGGPSSGYPFNPTPSSSGATGFTLGSSQHSSSSANPVFAFGSSQQIPAPQNSGFSFGNYNFNSNVITTANNNLPAPNLPFGVPTSHISSGPSPGFQMNTFNAASTSNSSPSVFHTFGAPNPKANRTGSHHFVKQFKKTPAYAGHNSSTDHRFQQYMFVGRVLVGRSCLGHRNMRRPGKDPHDPEGKICNTAVDSLNNPCIFVVFDSAQCYPEYLIQY